MRIITGLFIILFSFSYTFAAPTSDLEKDDVAFPSLLTLGIYGYGYIPMETDKDKIGYGGGGGFKIATNINRYFGLGFSTGFTVAKSQANNANNLTLLSDTRVFLIVQRETYGGESGFVPWGSLGFGFLTGEGDYGNYQKMEDALGFNIVLSAGVKYNFRKAYVGIGAEYSFARLYGDLVDNNYYNSSYYYPRKTGITMNPSGFTFFGELGYRF